MNHFLQLSIVTIIYAAISFNIASAQTKIKYGYDNSGNRKSRNIIVMQSAIADSAGTLQKSAPQKQVFMDNVGEQKVLIYPNPTRGQLSVEIQGANEETKIELYLYSLSGNLLVSISPASSSTPIDLTKHPIGTYILKVKVGSKTSEWKVVKE
jgi:hypothetical protein